MKNNTNENIVESTTKNSKQQDCQKVNSKQQDCPKGNIKQQDCTIEKSNKQDCKYSQIKSHKDFEDLVNEKAVFTKDNAVDKLATIFNMQKSFDEDIIKNRNLEGIEMTEWLQRQTLAMLSELAELLDEVNFKWWKNPKEVSINNVRDELVDILHFFVSMCIKAGMDSNELYKRYLAKNEENFKRQRGLSEKKGYEI